MYQPSSYPNEIFNIVIQLLYLHLRKSNHKKITNIAVILCSYKCNGQNKSLYEDHCDIMNMTSWPLIKFTYTLMFLLFTRFKQNIWSRMCRYRKMYLPPNRKDRLIIQWIIDTTLSCACYNIENKMKYIKVKLNHLRISILTTKVVQEKTSPNKSVVTESMELFTDLWHC